MQDDKAPLTVEQRTEIALDTVRAIHYLHTYEDEPMIHRDVKRYYSTWALVLVRYSIYQSIAILVNVRYRYLVVSRYFDISNIV